jgi:hypothetical protein
VIEVSVSGVHRLRIPNVDKPEVNESEPVEVSACNQNAGVSMVVSMSQFGKMEPDAS